MSNQPVKKFRLGFVSATIWSNEAPTGDRKFYTVDVQRTFKDGDDLRNTSSLNAADLLNAAKLLERAESWIAQQ